MNKFFKACRLGQTRLSPLASLSRLASRHFSTQKHRFKLSNNSHGTLLKITYTHLVNDASKHFAEILASYPNSLVIATEPTTRSSSIDGYTKTFNPGHNFSLITDDKGNIDSCLSKRPNTKLVMGQRQRIFDARFIKLAPIIKIFAPLFTSWQEEINHWATKGSIHKKSALYLHIFPLHGSVSSARYKTNVADIKDTAVPYSLHGTITPWGDYIGASNCNDATIKSISLIKNGIEQMFCQDAAKEMALSFIAEEQDKVAYIEMATQLGLLQGIEIPAIDTSEPKLMSSYC